jgi:hypothetical protein
MTGPTKQLPVAVVVTFLDLAALNSYAGVIWKLWGRTLCTRAALLLLPGLLVASAANLWLHVAANLLKSRHCRHSDQTPDSAIPISLEEGD